MKFSFIFDKVFRYFEAAILFSISGCDISDILSNFLYKSTCRKTHTQFFLVFFYFSFLRYKKNHHFLESKKIHINFIKYIKIFEPCYNLDNSGLHQLKRKRIYEKKKIGMHPLHRNKQKCSL